MRPTKTSTLIGDIKKARLNLGFNPKINFKQLIEIMVKADIEREKTL